MLSDERAPMMPHAAHLLLAVLAAHLGLLYLMSGPVSGRPSGRAVAPASARMNIRLVEPKPIPVPSSATAVQATVEQPPPGASRPSDEAAKPDAGPKGALLQVPMAPPMPAPPVPKGADVPSESAKPPSSINAEILRAFPSIKGRVVFAFSLDAEGRVLFLEPREGTAGAPTPSGMSDLMELRFTPATRKHQPVPGEALVTVNPD